MDPLLADRPRDDLHGAGVVVPPVTDPDFLHEAASRREQGGVPAEQAFLRQRGLIFLGGIEHHLDNAFDMPVGWRQCSDIESKAAGEGGAYLVDVEDFPLDLARFEHVLGQRTQHRLLAEPEAKALHPSDEPTLSVTHRRELVCQPVLIPVEPGPIVSFVDKHRYSPHVLRT